MNDLKKIFKGTLIYLVGTVLAKLVQFFLLPLYTKYLTPIEFGNYDLELAYGTFIWTIVYLDIFGGILRFMFDFKEDEKNRPVINGFIIFLGSTVIYGISIIVLKLAFGRELLSYPYLLFLVGSLTILQQVIGYIARGYGKDQIFVVGGILGTFATFVSTYPLLAIADVSYAGIYITTIIGMLVNILYVMIRIRLWEKINLSLFDFSLFTEMLKYSLPFSLNSVSYWFLTGFNRVIIANVLTVYDNGLYAVVTKFGAVITLFTQAFQMAWQELSFSKTHLSRKEMSKFYSTAINNFISFLLMGAALSLPFLSIVFKYLINEQYSEAYFLIPLALLSAVFTAYSSFMASIISTLKKTQQIFTTTIIGSIVNILVVLLLIKIIGVSAAMIAVSSGFFVIFLRRVQLVNKDIDISIKWNKFFKVVVLFMLVSLLYCMNIFLVNVFSILLVLTCFLLMYKDMIKVIIDKLFYRRSNK